MKKGWLDRFARAARWYLPRAEADDVIADYREMLAGDKRSEEELCRDLGKPRNAARLLMQPGPYRVRLVVFALLALCLVLPGISPLSGREPFFRIDFSSGPGSLLWNRLIGNPFLSYPLAFLGMSGALFCFYWKGCREKRIPGILLIVLAVLLGLLVLVLVFNYVWMTDDTGAIWDIWGYVPAYIFDRTDPRSIPLFNIVARGAQVLVGGPGMVVVGVYALVKAWTEDRRWAAVYILATAVMLVSLSSLCMAISITAQGITDLWQQYFSGYFYSYIGITVFALVGTGVALC